MAARVLKGAYLDDFQAARLRKYWFVPHVIDSSGWSSGKTVVEFLFADLRCMLIPDQVGGVYYTNFQLGKDAFWSNFANFKSDISEAQYLSGKNEWHDAGCYRKEYKNGSKLLLPAPGFLTDSENQASRRFNFLIVGEYTHSVSKGEGVKELIGRVSRQSFNQHHPLWGNHILLSAHAEAPTHPSYTYVKAAKDAISGKNSAAAAHNNALITFCYLDYSDKPTDPANPKSKTFKEKYRDEKSIDMNRRTLSKDDLRRKLLGLHTADGKGWYNEDIMKRCLSDLARVEIERPPTPAGTELFYTLGVDIAPGQGGRNDYCAFTVLKAMRYLDLQLVRTGDLPLATYEVANVDPHYLQPVYAHTFRNVDAGQISGFIHWLNMIFGFAKIVMDPGGGGLWVYKELLKPQQLVQNALKDVVPICSMEEANQTDKQPILVWFKRGSELDSLWPERRYLMSDEGIIEAAHRMFRGAWESGEFLCPQLPGEMAKSELSRMRPDERSALFALATSYKQLQSVRVKANSEGHPLLSKNGFFQFGAEGRMKKDAAYSFLYAYIAFRKVLHVSEGDEGGDEDFS